MAICARHFSKILSLLEGSFMLHKEAEFYTDLETMPFIKLCIYIWDN